MRGVVPSAVPWFGKAPRSSRSATSLSLPWRAATQRRVAPLGPSHFTTASTRPPESSHSLTAASSPAAAAAQTAAGASPLSSAGAPSSAPPHAKVDLAGGRQRTTPWRSRARKAAALQAVLFETCAPSIASASPSPSPPAASLSGGSGVGSGSQKMQGIGLESLLGRHSQTFRTRKSSYGALRWSVRG